MSTDVDAADGRGYPYWTLSGFYFAYFAVLGALVPFWGLFLQQRGFSLADIALITAIPLATRIVAPNLWGWIADRRNVRAGVIRAGSLVACIAFAGVWLADSFATMALVIAFYSFFWNAVLPQYEVVTLNHLGPRMAEYSRVRLWGSIGFIVAVVGLGAVFDVISVEWLPAFLFGLLAATAAAAFATRECPRAVARAGEDGHFADRLRNPVVWVLLLACLLVNFSHGPYYTYFSIHLEAHGWSRLGIGGLWALGVVAEVVVFLFMHRILARVDAVTVLAGAAVGATVRWLLLAFCVDNIAALLFAQVLHAASFGFLHASAIHLTHRLFTGNSQGRGQALFSSVNYGVGGAAGALVAGAMWPSHGAEVSFVAMSIAGGIALLLVLLVPANHPVRHAAAGDAR